MRSASLPDPFRLSIGLSVGLSVCACVRTVGGLGVGEAAAVDPRHQFDVRVLCLELLHERRADEFAHALRGATQQRVAEVDAGQLGDTAIHRDRDGPGWRRTVGSGERAAAAEEEEEWSGTRTRCVCSGGRANGGRSVRASHAQSRRSETARPRALCGDAERCGSKSAAASCRDSTRHARTLHGSRQRRCDGASASASAVRVRVRLADSGRQRGWAAAAERAERLRPSVVAHPPRIRSTQASATPITRRTHPARNATPITTSTCCLFHFSKQKKWPSLPAKAAVSTTNSGDQDTNSTRQLYTKIHK